jgi:transcriptional regulator NrdR family protein
MSTGTEVGFCPRCQATRTLRGVDTLALRRSADGTYLVRRRQLECESCNTFLSVVETPLRTEVVAGRS